MDVIYLFDSSMTLRTPIVKGISECIHNEAEYTLTAKIPTEHKAEPGEYLGFNCVDGRFRIFGIDNTEDDETEDMTTCICTDAAVSRLQATIVSDIEISGATPGDAAAAILSGTGWSVSASTTGRYTTDVKAFIVDAWTLLTEVAFNCDVRIIPRYSVSAGSMTGQVIDIEAKSSAFAGRIIENDVDAQSVFVTRSTHPRPKVYGLGATDENDKQLTFAEVEWSTANGDPADKPAGQSWIGVASAVAKYPGRAQVYEVQNCKDPLKLLEYTWREAKKAAQPKIGASAKISDMELMRGMTWKSMRLYDLAALHTRRKETVTKTIINIERDYVYPEDTRVTLGEEDERPPNIARDIAKIKAAAIGAGRSGGGAGAKAERNYLLLETQQVVVDELKTEISTVFVELDAVNTTLTLKAEKQELQKTEARITAAEVRLDGAEAEILLKASAEELKDVEKTVTDQGIEINATRESLNDALIRLDGAEAEIQLKASQDDVDALDEKINGAQIRLDGVERTIELKADKEEVDGLTKRVSQAEIDIDGANAAIALKASQEVVDGLDSRLSQAEIDIDGANASIALKADSSTVTALTKRVSQAEIDIDGLESTIVLKANLKDVTELGDRVSQAEIDIDGANAAIALKASREDMTELGKRVSQAEIDIDGANATIALKASREDMTELGKRVSQAEIDIDGANAAIDLKASREDVTELGDRVSQAEINIDGANAAIALKASQEYVDGLDSRLSQAEIDIDGANATIALKASQTVVDELGERVSSAEIEIDGAKSEITLKADKVYVDAQITEVKTLVADEIEATKADIELSIADEIRTGAITCGGLAAVGSLSTSNATIGALRLGTSSVSETTIPIVKSFTQALGESAPTVDTTFLTVA